MSRPANRDHSAPSCGSGFSRDLFRLSNAIIKRSPLKRLGCSAAAPSLRSVPQGLVALFVLLACPMLAHGLDRDRQQPMDIEADDADALLLADGRATLSGNVKIVQGTLQIEADRAIVDRQAGDFSRAVLDGQPARMQQALESGGTVKIRAGKIDYDMQADVVVLTGDVVITQPEGELRGERIRYDLATERMEGGAPGSRIRMRIEPRAEQAATPKSD